MGFLGFLAPVLGYVMEFIYMLVQSYGWAIILFTVIIRVVMFPLSIKQQKSTARMSAYQPHIQEIQKKYANDKQKQQEEMMKFQQENGMSMTAGCLPMALNMFVLFGVIQVVYQPLTYILHVGKEAIASATELATTMAASAGVAFSSVGYTAESALLGFMNGGNMEAFASVFGDKFEAVSSFNMSFMGMNLADVPSFTGFPNINWLLLIFPVLSLITMVASQIITMQMSGQEMQGAMKWMPWLMSAFFVYFCFTVPVAFSLYYTISNVMMLVQSIILKKMYDPQKIKEQIAAEIEAKRAEKKKKKTVAVKTETGEQVVKEVNEAELVRIRLAKARELDEQRYKE